MSPAAADLDFVPTTHGALEARVWSELNPDEPITAEEMGHRWESYAAMGMFEHFAIRSGVGDVGYATVGHFSWAGTDERYARIGADFLSHARSHFNLSAAYEFAEARALASGARDLIAHVRESDDFLILQLRRRGYTGNRIFRWWELDLSAEAGRLREMAAASRRRMSGAGIEVVTLAAAGGVDAVLDQLLALHNEATQDTPGDEPRVHADAAMMRTWLAEPGVGEDRFWLAREGGEVVGMSYLSYHGDRTWTGWTGTKRRLRGRGVARALKLETLVQAVELGIRRARTENDGENAPILHLNQELGYRPIPGVIQFHRAADVALDWNYKRAIFRDLGV